MARSCVGCLKCPVLCTSCTHTPWQPIGAEQVHVIHLQPYNGWASIYITLWYNSLVLVIQWIQFGDTLISFQVLLAHFDLLTFIKHLQTYTNFRSWLLGACFRAGDSIGLGPKPTKGIISKTSINNFEVGCHLGRFIFGSQSRFFNLLVLTLLFYKL